MNIDMETVRRAWGCMLGCIAGDALGSQVAYIPTEHMDEVPAECLEQLIGARAGSLPGQPSACSEMALVLARNLAEAERFDAEGVFFAYKAWLSTHPRDFDHAVFRALHGKPSAKDISSAALVRLAPLGILGARCSGTPEASQLDDDAMAEAGLTHPHPLCRTAAAAFAAGLAGAVAEGNADAAFAGARAAVERLAKNSGLMAAGNGDAPGIDGQASPIEAVRRVFESADNGTFAPAGAGTTSVCSALQNAFASLRAFSEPVKALRAVARLGGNTMADCSAAGALLGAVHGIDAFPDSWTDAVLACVPAEGRPGVSYPRPAAYHPADFMQLAEALLKGKEAG